MREKGQTEVAKTLGTPVFSRGIEILTEKRKIVGLFGNIDGYFSRLFLYGEAGGFFLRFRAIFKVKKIFFKFF